nr:spore coat protein YutH [Neobacillus sp. Marseille-Q6967]
MLQKLLEDQYGIKANEYVKLDSYEALRGNGWVYLVANPGARAAEDIIELEKLAEYLRTNGDHQVPAILPVKDGGYIATWKEKKYCVMANRQMEKPATMRLGRKLARFHERGRTVPFKIERTSRIGQWKQLWEKRLDQIEKVWNDMLFQTPENDFERMFIDSLPYYIGLTENAIQYLVDTEIDDNPAQLDSGTVCHERFLEKSWGENYYIKNPFDWVFDHRSRDLAEWTRERFLRNTQTYEWDVTQFFTDYQAVAPLSSFSWRLLFSRLLFPIHYFECIENYYISQSEQEKRLLEEKLNKMLRQSSEYERFLSKFFQIAGTPMKQLKIPQPEWLVLR